MKTTVAKPSKSVRVERKAVTPKTESVASTTAIPIRKRIISRFAGLCGNIEIYDMKAVLK